LKNEFHKPKKLKNHHKIPLYPPFSKGEANISSLWKREAGRDFQSAKVLRNFKQNILVIRIWSLEFIWDLEFVIWDLLPAGLDSEI
jgi:hypothetical protein